jgi:hypothetical protein
MDAFYRIAKGYWQSKEEAVDRAQRRTILQDVEKCEQLVERSKEGLGKLAKTVRSYRQKKWPFASGLSRNILKEMADWQERLRGLDHKWEPYLRARKRTLSIVTRKTLELEFIIDLEMLLKTEFSQPREKVRDGLVAAAMAAAGVFTKAAIEDEVNLIVGLIPAKRKRAREYFKKQYTNPEIEQARKFFKENCPDSKIEPPEGEAWPGFDRVYAWLPKPRPQTPESTAPRARKKSKQRSLKRSGTRK